MMATNTTPIYKTNKLLRFYTKTFLFIALAWVVILYSSSARFGFELPEWSFVVAVLNFVIVQYLFTVRNSKQASAVLLIMACVSAVAVAISLAGQISSMHFVIVPTILAIAWTYLTYWTHVSVKNKLEIM
jgi:hypothetical protein